MILAAILMTLATDAAPDVNDLVRKAIDHEIRHQRQLANYTWQERTVSNERDGKKNFVKRKPPEHHFVSWDPKTFERLKSAAPEPLVSRFQITHGMLLNVLSRESEDGCRAMQRLVREAHDSPKAKEAHRTRGWQLFRSLVERKIIELVPKGIEGQKRLRLNVELQHDFSLNESLSLYLLDTLKLIDPNAVDYHLVLLTLVESILENPEAILRKQLDRVKSRAMGEMKQEGVPYEERIAKLEELEYPKPNREFIYSTFNEFAAKHPWLGQENIRPKSIAREMYENFRSFNDYVKDYELNRAEGLLLRHLASVYRTMAQTVPNSARTETVREVELFFGTMLEQVDTSLFEEWARLRNPDAAVQSTSAGSRAALAEAAAAPTPEYTQDTQEFTRQVRQYIFGLLGALRSQDYEAACGWLAVTVNAEGAEWGEREFKARLDVYHAQTRPLVQYYTHWADSGDVHAPKYRSISGLGSVEDITARALAALH